MKCVYIASRVSGEIERNMALAKVYCLYAMSKNVVPVVPHLMLEGVLDDNDPEERTLGITVGLELLRKCDEIWAFTDERGISEGMANEISLADQLKIPIRFVDWNKIKNEVEDVTV